MQKTPNQALSKPRWWYQRSSLTKFYHRRTKKLVVFFMEDLKAKHVLIVFLVAIITGLILGVSGWVLVGLLEFERSWLYGAGVGVITTSLTWLFLVKRGLRMIENLLGVDLDQDGFIGDPEQEPRIIIMDETDLGRTHGIILHKLPGGEARFSRLSAGILDGVPMAERYWTGSAGPYSLKEFRDLRDYLLLRGLLSWQSELDHRQGVDIQPPGRALMRRYAHLARSETLPIEVSNWPK